MKTCLSVLVAILLFCSGASSQNENTKWYFGANAALDFMTANPSLLNNSAMNTAEGSASIADAAGNLLFYTDGVTVYNQQHLIMANGTGLLGDQSTSQSALIIKKPGSSTLYYIFTLGAGGGSFNYSVVDMSLAAGMGSVTVLNAPLYAGPCAEQLHGTKHANGTDYWVLVHELNSSNFRSFRLSSAGVNTTAVISSSGMAYSLYGTYGCMKLSPTGQKVGVAVGNVQLGSVEVSDFNNSTGVVSNALNLATYNFYYAYGCEFSPDGTKFYSCGHNSSYLTQWDLNAGSPAAIVSSSVTLYYPGSFASMQLAPNGKLYVANHGASVISVINSPNTASVACNFVLGGQPVNIINVNTNVPAQAEYGLPNMIVSPCYIGFTMQNNNAICNIGGGNATITNVYGNTGTVSYFWTNGTTTLTAPQASNMAVGTWSVAIRDSLGCTTNTIFNVYQAPSFSPDVVSNINSCAGNTVILNVFGATSYTWSNGAQTSSTAVSPNSTTQYSVSMTDQNNCVLNDVIITVNVAPVPAFTVSSTNPNICPGNTVALTVSGANSYTWSNGAQTPNITVSPTVTTSYFVTVADGTVCLKTVPVATVNILPLPTLTVSGTFKICTPQTVTLSASGASSYTWSAANSPTTSSIAIPVTTTTQFTVSGTNQAGCTSSKIVTVTVGCVGIQGLEAKNDAWKIFPNPAGGTLNVEINVVNAKSDLILIDLLGNEVMRLNDALLLFKNGVAQIDISAIKSGVYFIRVGNQVRRFVKE